MTIGHIKELIKHLPDDMIAVVPVGNGDAIPVCVSKSGIKLVRLYGQGGIDRVLMLSPCVCEEEIVENSTEIAQDLLNNSASDN